MTWRFSKENKPDRGCVRVFFSLWHSTAPVPSSGCVGASDVVFLHGNVCSPRPPLLSLNGDGRMRSTRSTRPGLVITAGPPTRLFVEMQGHNSGAFAPASRPPRSSATGMRCRLVKLRLCACEGRCVCDRGPRPHRRNAPHALKEATKERHFLPPVRAFTVGHLAKRNIPYKSCECRQW